MLHPVEIDLYLSEESPQSTVIPPGEGRYSFDALRRMTGLRSQTLHEKPWVETWAGAVTNDTLSPLRATILPGYRPPKMQLSENSRRRRRGQGRHEHSSAITGRWHHTPDKIDSTPMGEEELGKERVKLLLGHWHRLFRSLRLMELSGEVLSGPFYDNVRGLQFTTRENVTLLQNRDATPFWLNACDPSSICGLKCSNLKLPARRRTTHLAYIGHRLAIVSRRSGRHLDIHIPPDDPQMENCLALFNHLLRRPLKPLKRIIIESINNEPAIDSAYVKAFETLFHAHDEGTEFVLYRN